MYPYIVLFGRSIPSYGLCMSCAIAFCWVFAYTRTKIDRLSSDHLLIIGASTLGFALIGAKLLYLAVSVPFAQLPEFVRSGQLLTLMNSGQVFYGGLLGGILGAKIGAIICPTRLMSYERAIVPALPFGYGFGRIGCYLAGCCYGISCGTYRFPVQLLDATVSFALGGALILYSKKPRRPYRLLLLYLLCYAVQRFSMEFLRGDLVRGFCFGLSTSQWISLLLALICSVLLLSFRIKTRHLP